MIKKNKYIAKISSLLPGVKLIKTTKRIYKQRFQNISKDKCDFLWTSIIFLKGNHIIKNAILIFRIIPQRVSKTFKES